MRGEFRVNAGRMEQRSAPRSSREEGAGLPDLDLPNSAHPPAMYKAPTNLIPKISNCRVTTPAEP